VREILGNIVDEQRITILEPGTGAALDPRVQFYVEAQLITPLIDGIAFFPVVRITLHGCEHLHTDKPKLFAFLHLFQRMFRTQFIVDAPYAPEPVRIWVQKFLLDILVRDQPPPVAGGDRILYP